MEQDIYLYPGSQSEAHRLGEAALWDASFHANVSCARDIEAVIRVYAARGFAHERYEPMSATVAAAVKAAIVILSNEEARKKVGWGIVAILSPLIVLVVLLCAILSGTSQHNVSAVELCFHGGSISASATPEYQRYIEDMIMLQKGVAMQSPLSKISTA